MSEKLWTSVDRYMTDHLVAPDAALDAALRANRNAELPAIDVAPNQGKLLHLLARLSGAKRILEIGTLGGYSTIWLARALPTDGKLITLEFSPVHASVAAENIARAGLSEIVEIRIGAALDSLQALVAEAAAPFDFIFIDANKDNLPEYLQWSLRLSHIGTVIIADNVVRDGAVLDAESTDPNIQGVRRFYEMLTTESRIDCTALQTVGSKGYDGFAIGLVIA